MMGIKIRGLLIMVMIRENLVLGEKVFLSEYGVKTSIEVNCGVRYRLYKKFIFEFIEKFPLKDFANPFISKFVTNPEIYRNLAERLDKTVFDLKVLKNQFIAYYSDISNENFYKEALKSKDNGELLKFKDKVSRNCFAHYLNENHIFGEPTEYLLNDKNKKWNELLNYVYNDRKMIFVAERYRQRITKILKDLIVDKKTLKTNFFLGNEFVLTGVTFFESDLHKIDGGVSLLEFECKKEKMKIVYKTSSVLMDLLLVGDTKGIEPYLEAMGYVDEAKIAIKSFSELINIGMEDQKKSTMV
jgi:hypothetical protein